MNEYESPSDHPELPQGDSPVDSSPPHAAAPVRVLWSARVITILVLSLALFAACVTGLVMVRTHADPRDFAQANVQTLVLSFVAFLSLIALVFFWPGLPRSIRWAPVVIFLSLVFVAAVVYRIDSVDGRLVPKFTPRWLPRPDQMLAAPQIIDDPRPVDLKSSTPHDFPQFLGPGRDLRVTGIPLHRDWATEPPRELWRRPIGAGWSGFSAVNGFAVTLEQRGEEELVTCYEMETGKPRWAHSITARHETVLGGVGPRSTPTLDDGMVYALGATGVLRCLDGATGSLVWSDDILDRYGVTPEEDGQGVAWGRSASPLVVEDLLIVPFGGPAKGPWFSLAAYDKRSGELVWRGGDRQVSYASPSLVNLAGIRHVVIVNEDSVSGHRIEDGQVLWSYPWPGSSTNNASTSQAVVTAGDRVLLSKAYGTGSELLQLAAEPDGRLTATSLWSKPGVLKTKFTNLAVIDGFAYGLSDGLMECVEVDTGEVRWKDRRRGNFGHGQILAVDDLILVQAESGEVVMLEANPRQLVELGRFAPLSSKTWNNLCLYGRYLLVRNAVEAACYELPLRS
jgi:outer membrane protein assembly factor BamB